jgi:hypothetical protein
LPKIAENCDHNIDPWLKNFKNEEKNIHDRNDEEDAEARDEVLGEVVALAVVGHDEVEEEVDADGADDDKGSQAW